MSRGKPRESGGEEVFHSKPKFLTLSCPFDSFTLPPCCNCAVIVKWLDGLGHVHTERSAGEESQERNRDIPRKGSFVMPVGFMGSDHNDNLDGPVLEVYLLGLIDYEDGLRLQRRLVYEVSGSRGQLAGLILCEHPPTITVGRLGSRAHIECDDEELAARGLTVRWINRGGGCNLHVPGQLIAYPVWPVDSQDLGIAQYLARLESCLVGVLREFDIRGTVRPDHSGIWTSAGQIASIGVSVSRWVSYHGMTLNVAGAKDQFRIIHPEGNGQLRATTLEAERLRPAPMAKVRECLIHQFVATFQPARYDLYTHHPMLTRQGRSRVYAKTR